MSETIVDKDEFDRYAEQLVLREVYELGQLELEDEDDYWLVVNSTGQFNRIAIADLQASLVSINAGLVGYDSANPDEKIGRMVIVGNKKLWACRVRLNVTEDHLGRHMLESLLATDRIFKGYVRPDNTQTVGEPPRPEWVENTCT